MFKRKRKQPPEPRFVHQRADIERELARLQRDRDTEAPNQPNPDDRSTTHA